MPMGGGIGFFGKLPAAGDFIQRRLPGRFVEVWDNHFSIAVARARERFGADWMDAFQAAPSWRFVLSPGVCTHDAWAGLAGPSVDRVGRGFPMVMATALSAGPGAAVRLIDAGGGWYSQLEAVYARGQERSLDVDGFDAATASLDDTLDVRSEPDPIDIRDNDWNTADHWRIPLPSAPSHGAWLAELWVRITASGDPWCLWWTGGAGQARDSVLITRGLPGSDAYVAFIDPSQADGVWQVPHPAGAMPPADVTAPVRAWSQDEDVTVQPAVSYDSDQTQPVRAVQPPVPPPPAEPPRRALGDVHRVEAAGGQVLVICADEGAPGGPHSGASRAAEAVRDWASSGAEQNDLTARLLQLHGQLRREAPEARDDTAVLALRSNGEHAQLMRVGSAAAWLWRRGSVRPLFGQAAAGSDDLDDLLFGSATTIAPGIGGGNEPVTDQSECQLEPGDRLLLLVTRALAELHEPVVHSVLASPSCEDAAQSIARTCHLAGEPGRWPLAVIEISA